MLSTTLRTNRWIALAAVCALAAFPLVAAAQDGGKHYALLVGVKEYQHARLPSLKYSENDVVELAQLLRKSAYQVSLLCDSEGKKDEKNAPTKANIDRQLKAMLEKAKQKDSILIAFAGHGLQFENLNVKDAFFCPSDARP